MFIKGNCNPCIFTMQARQSPPELVSLVFPRQSIFDALTAIIQLHHPSPKPDSARLESGFKNSWCFAR